MWFELARWKGSFRSTNKCFTKICELVTNYWEVFLKDSDIVLLMQ